MWIGNHPFYNMIGTGIKYILNNANTWLDISDTL